MPFNLTSFNDKFFIDDSGKVGILNQNPQYELDVIGESRITNKFLAGNYYNSNSPVLHIENGKFILNTEITNYYGSDGYSYISNPIIDFVKDTRFNLMGSGQTAIKFYEKIITGFNIIEAITAIRSNKLITNIIHNYNSIYETTNYIGSNSENIQGSHAFSNFIGYSTAANAKGNNVYSNLIGYYAGTSADDFDHSVFIGDHPGYSSSGCSYSIFIGSDAGRNSKSVNNSILIGNYTSGKAYSISIGQGTSNIGDRRLNIGNILYGINLDTGISPSSNPITTGRIGILINDPQYTLDVNGTCRITEQTYFSVRPTVNGSGVLLNGEGGPSSTTTLNSIGNGIKIVTGADGNNYNVKSLSGINGIKVATGIDDQYLTIEYTGSTTNGLSTSENIITQKNGYGAGIYTFSGSVLSTQTGKVFGVFDSKTGCQIFDVMINAGYPVAKKYTVAHQTNQNPITYLNANTGPSGSNDFEALFYASGSSGVAMSIKNLGNDSVFSTTLILGASVSPVVVTVY